jgi:predicted metalloprotease with PDZ domain
VDDGDAAARGRQLVERDALPRCRRANELVFAPSLKLPAGWQHATSLHPAPRSRGEPRLELRGGDGRTRRRRDRRLRSGLAGTLIDSPVLAGAHFKTVDLTRDRPRRTGCTSRATATRPCAISEDDAARTPARRRGAGALRRAALRQYQLPADSLGPHRRSNGLEHHESSDNRAAERSLIDADAKKVLGTLLSHEYVHSWNGKYRGPRAS